MRGLADLRCDFRSLLPIWLRHRLASSAPACDNPEKAPRRRSSRSTCDEAVKVKWSCRGIAPAATSPRDLTTPSRMDSVTPTARCPVCGNLTFQREEGNFQVEPEGMCGITTLVVRSEELGGALRAQGAGRAVHNERSG